MSEKKAKFSRRQALNLGAASVLGAHATLNMGGLVGGLLPNMQIFSKLKQILATGDAQALAQANKPLTPPLVQLVWTDKQIEPGMFKIPALSGITTFDGTLLNGFELTGFVPRFKANLFSGPLNELMAHDNSVEFRGTAYSKLFGRILAGDSGLGLPGLPSNYNLAFMTKGQKNGNHVVNDANMGRDKGSLASVFEAEAKKLGMNTGILGPVIFNIRSGATGSSTQAFISAGGSPMPSVGSASEVRQTLRNSVAALNADDKFKDYRRSLDRLVSSSDQSLDNLEEIRKKTNVALEKLQAALTAADFVDQQLETIFALYDSGLSANFGISIPCRDTNGGGDIRGGGGDFNLSPVESSALLAYIIVRLARWNPEVRFRVDTDGTRSSNWNDASGRIAIVGGPSAILNHGVYGPIPGATTLADLGTNRGNDGTSYKSNETANINSLSPMHDQALVASMMGIPDEKIGVPYPTEYLGRKIKV